MRRILIICDLFPPAFAPRMGYLCKYLKASGWEPTVITEDIKENTFSFLANECEVHRIKFYTNKNNLAGKFQNFITVFREHCFNYKDRRMYKEACKVISQKSFDLILCSTFRTFPLLAALKTAQRFNYPLIVDIRDIIEEYTGNEFIKAKLPSLGGLDKLIISFFKKKMIRNRDKVLKAADHITTISPWHKDFLKCYNPNVTLIYNGFDPDIFYPASAPTDKFIITYTGRLLSINMRDPSLLFEALAILSEENKVSPDKCRVRWYIDDHSEMIIKENAKKYKVENYMDYMSYVSGDLIPGILNESSILLLLTNKADKNGPKGIMTTKFFESLAVEKPILCVRSDEDCLEMAIKEANAGIAARNTQETSEFIYHHFQNWEKSGSTSIKMDKRILKKYSRKEQVHQFIHIFESLI